MVPLRGRIYKPLPGSSIINHKSQKLNYLRASPLHKEWGANIPLLNGKGRKKP